MIQGGVTGRRRWRPGRRDQGSPATEPAVVEIQTEPRRHRARVSPQVWMAEVEYTALGTEAEAGIQKAVVEPE